MIYYLFIKGASDTEFTHSILLADGAVAVD